MPPKPGEYTQELERLVGRARSGDAQALNDLIGRACRRLEDLTRRMLRRFPLVRRWEQTDDVLQNALIRLHRALTAQRVESVQHFFCLAAKQIRWELLDLAKHHFGSLGQGAKHHTDGGGRAADDTGGPLARQPDADGEPVSLEEWTGFHEQASRLPEEEREVFDLLWYQGLTQEDAAQILGVTVRTVKRRWQRARVLLHEALKGEAPR
jgi:RNA polymerase sigma-70 factor (ECF subfamily)